MFKFYMQMLVLFSITNSLANYGGGVGLGNSSMQPMLFNNQLVDESGNLTNSKEAIETVSRNLSFIFQENEFNKETLTSENLANSLKFNLETYGLNKPENQYLLDEVYSSLAKKLAQREAVFKFDESKTKEGGFSKPEVSFKTTNALEKFTTTLDLLEVPEPSGLSDALALKAIVDEAGDDHRKYISLVNEKLSNEEKAQAIRSGLDKFKHTSNVKHDFVKEMINGEIDQNTLYNLLSLELYSQHFSGESDKRSLETIELLLSKFDFYHKPGGYQDLILCQAVQPLFSQTRVGVREFENMMAEYNDNSLNQGQGGQSLPIPVMPEQEYEKLRQNSNKISQKQIDILLRNGADTNVICSDGLSVRDKFEMIKEDNVLGYKIKEKESHAISKTVPCSNVISSEDLVGLCDTIEIMAHFQNTLLRNERISQKHLESKELNFSNGRSNEKCNFVLIDKMMRKTGQVPAREIELQIIPRNSDKTFTLKGNEKSLFIKKLEQISGNSK